MAALLREMRRRSAERQLTSPNYRTVLWRIAALDPRFVMRKRQGARAAREKFGPSELPVCPPTKEDAFDRISQSKRFYFSMTTHFLFDDNFRSFRDHNG